MWYNAASGAPRTQFSIFIFYSLLFSFLVIFIQVSNERFLAFCLYFLYGFSSEECIHTQKKDRLYLNLVNHELPYRLSSPHELGLGRQSTCTLASCTPFPHTQQSIFLVVIIESFADLRVESSSDSTKPVTDKPAIVLSDPLGQGNELHLTLIKKESSNAFQRYMHRMY